MLPGSGEISVNLFLVFWSVVFEQLVNKRIGPEKDRNDKGAHQCGREQIQGFVIARNGEDQRGRIQAGKDDNA